MQELDFLDINKIRKKLCTECRFCMLEKNTMSCSQGYFDSVSLVKGRLFMPILFDCIEYEPKIKE